MSASHRLILTFDEATGELALTHRCTVELAGHAVSHAEAVALDDPGPGVEFMHRLVEGNRAAMEALALQHATKHVGALSGKVEKGRTALTLTGRVGPIGGVK